MKNIYLRKVILLLILMSVHLMGCGNDKNVEIDMNYSYIDNTYVYKEDKMDIDICYPQITGMSDEEKEERINVLIKEDAKRLIREVQVDEGAFCVWLDYDVTMINEELISIVYKGMEGVMLPGSGLDATAMATVIDMKEEKILSLEEVVIDFEKLSAMLLNDKFKSITMWDGMEGCGRISREYAGKEELLLVNLRAGNKDTDARYVEWYMDDEKFIIISLYGSVYEEYAINMQELYEAEIINR